VTTPFRGMKGQVYGGGIRVPGIIEWPRRIPRPRVTDVNAVTSDMLPTICDLLGLPLPERPLDGISLKPLINGEMTKRPTPICFWSYQGKNDTTPYIDAELQEGTTPLVKQMGGRYTRNFRNLHHPKITPEDFAGARAILDNRYKLVIHDQRDGEPKTELFDVRDDPAEKVDLSGTKSDIAKNLEQQLRDWQQSVLQSLTGADYR
jgi:arylsulfatase A-like enzyme